MGNIKQINVKSRTYYFFNDMINIKEFDSSQLKTDKIIIQKHWYLLYRIHLNKKY